MSLTTFISSINKTSTYNLQAQQLTTAADDGIQYRDKLMQV